MKYLTWALPSFWPLGTMLLPLKSAKGIQMTLLPEGKEQVLLSFRDQCRERKLPAEEGAQTS